MKKIYILLCLNSLFIQGEPMQKVLCEGKTKIICANEQDKKTVVVQSKDDIGYVTTNMHDVIQGKAAIATDTTCNVFRLLKACGIPVAFIEQLDDRRFLAPKCEMIPYEVIARREGHGSFLKRYPHLQKGQLFPQLVVEFFLKTTDKKWEGTAIPEDDPFIEFKDDKAVMYHPKAQFVGATPCLELEDFPLKDRPECFEQMEDIVRKTFLILENAWQSTGRRLVDFKVEFGFDADGNLLLADVIDNDSWRVMEDGQFLDKQFYRDGGDLNEVTKRYTKVRDLTSQFSIPKQQLIMWRASERDDIEPFLKAFEPFKDVVELKTVTASLHKEPVRALMELQQMVQEVPDSVALVYVGRSNGAGPTISTHTSIPVITVPNGWRNCPEDVWSSLRTPSLTPVMTVLEPANAVLAAMQMLAKRNPAVYANVRMQLEKRLMNIITV